MLHQFEHACTKKSRYVFEEINIQQRCVLLEIVHTTVDSSGDIQPNIALKHELISTESEKESGVNKRKSGPKLSRSECGRWTFKINRALICACIIMMLFSGASFSYFPDSSFLVLADSLFSLDSDSQQTRLAVKKDNHKYYMVTTCKTIQCPKDSIVRALQDIRSYHNYFSFMKESDFVSGENSQDSIALFEAGVLWYRAYYFGRISAEFPEDSTWCFLRCGNANQKECKDAWRKDIGGLIKIGFHDMEIFWKIEDRGNGISRISLTTSQSPAVWIPQWLMEIGAKNIFPGMLRDIEKHLKNNSQNITKVKKRTYSN